MNIDEPKIIKPVCPKCGVDPASFNACVITLPAGRAIVFFCGEAGCRAVYSVTPIVDQGVRAAQPSESRIVMPGMVS